MSIPNRRPTIGIVVGGGPAPGINGVIHAVTIQAINNGFQVVGILEGFKHLIAGRLNVRPLTIRDVSRIHTKGGTILKTSRANPTVSEETLKNTVNTLVQAGVSHLVSVGGDDTAFSAYTVTRYAREKMGVDIRSVHVPKTIDNDLPLPEGVPTFGHETAREMGTRIVKNIMEDALSTGRWYIIVAMGRKAGHLAMGIGKSAGATLTLIPEEWQGKPTRMQHVGDIIADLNSRRGKVRKIERHHNTHIVHAEAPLAELFGYATAIRSLTKGRAGYSMEPTRFEVVPLEIQQQILG